MKPKPSNASEKGKAVERKASIKDQKINKTGLTTRIQGHVAARGRRTQARRDSR